MLQRATTPTESQTGLGGDFVACQIGPLSLRPGDDDKEDRENDEEENHTEEDGAAEYQVTQVYPAPNPLPLSAFQFGDGSATEPLSETPNEGPAAKKQNVCLHVSS